MDILVAQGATPQDAFDNLGTGTFHFLSMHTNCDIGIDAARLTNPPKALHGATSCLGSMTDKGFQSGVSVFAIQDSNGAYGSAASHFENGPQEAAREATRQALMRADRWGERPDLVWISATPGFEEKILAGIEDIVGADIPIIGGSAADNSVNGDWFIFDAESRFKEGVVVSVLFPSTPISFAYQNGYSPTAKMGFVTKANQRTIYEIDGKPAMDVYSQWTDGAVPKIPDGAQSAAILSQSTLWPFGREINHVDEVPFYLLAHPAIAHSGGAIELFSTVQEGERLTLMNGKTERLKTRAGRVAALARQAGGGADKPISGALLIYCGGCMLSAQDELDKIIEGVNEALAGAPFLGAFTFGEQGSLLKSGNLHGNLMISCIIFG